MSIASRLYDRRVALLAASFSALAVLQIQQSHFFTVDTVANLFILLSAAVRGADHARTARLITWLARRRLAPTSPNRRGLSRCRGICAAWRQRAAATWIGTAGPGARSSGITERCVWDGARAGDLVQAECRATGDHAAGGLRARDSS